MRKFWALARVNATMALYQMNIVQRRRRNGRTGRGFMVGMGVVAAIIMAYMVFWAVMLSIALNPDGLEWVILPIGLLIVIFLVLTFSMFTLDSLLFDNTDTDTLFAYPVTKFTVVAGKIGGLLVQNWLIVAILWLPYVVVYGCYAHPGVLFYVFGLLCLLIMPGVPLFAMGLISYVVGLVTSGSRFRRVFSVGLTLLLIVGMAFGLRAAIPALEANSNAGGDAFSMLQRIYPPLGWATTALAKESIGAMGMAILWNVLPFLALCGLVSMSYAFIRTRVATVKKPRHTARIRFGSTTAARALYRKELSRLVYSPIYLMNSCVGALVLVLLAILAGRAGANLTTVENTLESAGVLIAQIILVFFLFMLCISNTTAPSISLEGKSLWIVKSAPVNAKPVLRAKLGVQATVIAPLVVIAAVIMIFTLHVGVLGFLAVAVPAVLFTLVSACVGLAYNLHVYRLDYSNDMQAVRSSANVMMTMGTMMAVVAVATLGYVFAFHFKVLGFWPYWGVWVAILAVAAVVLYRYLMTQGVKLFEALD